MVALDQGDFRPAGEGFEEHLALAREAAREEER